MPVPQALAVVGLASLVHEPVGACDTKRNAAHDDPERTRNRWPMSRHEDHAMHRGAGLPRTEVASRNAGVRATLDQCGRPYSRSYLGLRRHFEDVPDHRSTVAVDEPFDLDGTHGMRHAQRCDVVRVHDDVRAAGQLVLAEEPRRQPNRPAGVAQAAKARVAGVADVGLAFGHVRVVQITVNVNGIASGRHRDEAPLGARTERFSNARQVATLMLSLGVRRQRLPGFPLSRIPEPVDLRVVGATQKTFKIDVGVSATDGQHVVGVGEVVRDHSYRPIHSSSLPGRGGQRHVQADNQRGCTARSSGFGKVEGGASVTQASSIDSK